ncbi:clan AA aspartic protease [Leptolyngbya boryana FACHB-1624]|uniref:clan AA aspartic protease n=1 Tax=Leptolyngbya sp. FACHB-1624 TaxID=2692802 RepID=UPI0016887FFF|nr:clan AA aspartic protease [Leptolyngbya sp. FACHB-1624]MBD1855112.1 clan AA aspartic protease [Leptolyngbya sp. FACHB-1624]
MIHGVVDQNCEATVRLVVGNADTERQVVDAIIDTGFTGFLTLPHSVLSTLNLKPYSREEGTLADGSEVIFDVYSGFVIWDGAFRRIDINASDATPLAGMSLLYGYRVQFDTIEGGEVKIQAFHELNQNLQ